MFKIVKCPETARLHVVECVETPLGHLIYRCTRFRYCAMKCTRGCATEIDEAVVTRQLLREVDGELALDLDLDNAPIS